MGLFKWIAAGIVAKGAHNKFNPPQITVPDGIQLVGLKAKGLNEYRIKFKKNGSNVTEQFTVSRNVRSKSGGWEFHWD